MNRHAGAHRHTYTLDWIINMSDDEKYTKKRRFHVQRSEIRQLETAEIDDRVSSTAALVAVSPKLYRLLAMA